MQMTRINYYFVCLCDVTAVRCPNSIAIAYFHYQKSCIKDGKYDIFYNLYKTSSFRNSSNCTDYYKYALKINDMKNDLIDNGTQRKRLTKIAFFKY